MVSVEAAAHGLTAILATWLGLLVLTRARKATGAPVFGLLSLLLVIWSLAIIGQRYGTNLALHPVLNVFEDFGAFLLPAATAHLGIAVALEGRRSRFAATILAVGYGVGLAAWLQTAVDPAHPILPGPPHFEVFGIPGAVLGWGFIAVRAGLFAVGIGWLLSALRHAGDDVARQRQLQVTLVTLTLGILGGMARILPEGAGGPPWVGVSLIALAAVIAVYAVLAQRLFAGAVMTARAFRLSVLIGLGVAAYVAGLVLVDRLVADAVGLDVPIVVGLALVVTIAVFDPVANLVRHGTGGADDPEAARSRLLHALGEDVLSGPRHEDIVAPAMARLVRTFDLAGAAILDPDGRPTFVHGDVEAPETYTTRVRLESGEGHAAFGPKRSGLPLASSEIDLLRQATAYLDANLRLGARQEAHATALAELSREGEAIDERGVALVEALAHHTVPRRGLHVYAMGALRAEIDGESLVHWGGAKAGSRQAEGIFGFLFDRGERGASKDEIIELVWPDTDLDRADVAFHRTMLGLRSALVPARSRRDKKVPIEFANDRYRLTTEIVAWSDVAQFDDLLARARAAGQLNERLHLLEAARALYRGDLLDDCPYYGDSAHVEEHREELRERYVDVLVDLGLAYADRGERAAASDALRRATTLTDRDLPVVADAIERLHAVTADSPRQPHAAEGTA